MADASRSAGSTRFVDTTDWVKTAAIILVTVDHVGYFFIEHDLWWSTLGRLAAPPFFFFLGYAETRIVPRYWIWLGVILTLLESWNAGWAWVAANLLLSFALIRMTRPYVRQLLLHHGWTAFAFLVLALGVASPLAGGLVDYGAEGWLWSLCGLCQRMYVDASPVPDGNGTARGSASSAPAPAEAPAQMRLVACLAAVILYVWQEQTEYAFPPVQLAAFILGIGALSVVLALYRRGPSRIQPPEPAASTLRFMGRHTLQIYAIELVAFELIQKIAPRLVV